MFTNEIEVKSNIDEGHMYTHRYFLDVSISGCDELMHRHRDCIDSRGEHFAIHQHVSRSCFWQQTISSQRPFREGSKCTVSARSVNRIVCLHLRPAKCTRRNVFSICESISVRRDKNAEWSSCHVRDCDDHLAPQTEARTIKIWSPKKQFNLVNLSSQRMNDKLLWKHKLSRAAMNDRMLDWIPARVEFTSVEVIK
jgi:hypothetical protein